MGIRGRSSQQASGVVEEAAGSRGGPEERRGGDERGWVPRTKAAQSSRCRCSKLERVPVVEEDDGGGPHGRLGWPWEGRWPRR